MRTSVALATYNGAEHLQAQLDSYTRQSRLPDEVVICDDCSQDETLRIAREFATAAPFEVRVHENDVNLGYAANFARVLSLCAGDLIFLSDQDDVWLEHKIERVVEVAEQSGALLVVHDLELVGPQLERSGVTMTSRLRLLGRSRRAHIKGCCTAVRRELVELAFPTPEAAGHDNWLHELADVLGRRRFLPEVLLLYRLHHTNTSRWAIGGVPVNATTEVSARRRASSLVYGLKRVLKPRSRDELDWRVGAYSQVLTRAVDKGIAVDDVRRVATGVEQRHDAVHQGNAWGRTTAVARAWRRGAYPTRWRLALAARDLLRP